MRRLALLFVVAACSGTDPEVAPPDAGPVASCPAAAEVTVGGACAVAADLVCFTGGDVCGASWGSSSFAPCHCQDGAWSCDDLYPTDGAGCPFADGTACNREGPGGCNDWGQPSGAACSCHGGAWICDDTCFMECPASYRDSLPGRSCQFGETCTYAATTCTCSAEGTIACQP